MIVETPQTANNNVPENTETATTLTMAITSTTTTMHQAVTWIDVHMGLGVFGVNTLLLKSKLIELPKQQQQDKPRNHHNEAQQEAIFWKQFQDLANELDHWFPSSYHPFCNKAALQIV